MKIYNAKLRKNIDITNGKHNFCQFFMAARMELKPRFPT